MYPYKAIRVNGKKWDEHRWVWTQHNGPIPEGGIIHHKNENKRDNRIENLELIANNSVHTKNHNPHGPWSNMDDEDRKTWEESRDKVNKERRNRRPAGTNWCSLCRQYLPVSQFHKSRGRFNGLAYECKECRKKLRTAKVPYAEVSQR